MPLNSAQDWEFKTQIRNVTFSSLTGNFKHTHRHTDSLPSDIHLIINDIKYTIPLRSIVNEFDINKIKSTIIPGTN